jgi:hypothetical protein
VRERVLISMCAGPPKRKLMTPSVVSQSELPAFGPKGRHILCRGCEAPESLAVRLESPNRGDTTDASQIVSPLSGLYSRGTAVSGASQPRQWLCQPYRACTPGRNDRQHPHKEARLRVTELR